MQLRYHGITKKQTKRSLRIYKNVVIMDMGNFQNIIQYNKKSAD